jgi:hypothetical protein
VGHSFNQQAFKLRIVVSLFLIVTVFVCIAGFPWLYWEAARVVMRNEAPIYLAWLVSKDTASGMWWLMGLTLWLWAPFFLGLGVLAAKAVLEANLDDRPLDNEATLPSPPTTGLQDPAQPEGLGGDLGDHGSNGPR